MSETEQLEQLKNDLRDAQEKISTLQRHKQLIEENLAKQKHSSDIVRLIDFLNDLKQKHEAFKIKLNECSTYRYGWRDVSNEDIQLIRSNGFSAFRVLTYDLDYIEICYPPEVQYNNLGFVNTDLKFYDTS